MRKLWLFWAGAVETTLAEVLTARGRALRLPLGTDSTGQAMVISACEDASIGAEVHLHGSLADCARIAAFALRCSAPAFGHDRGPHSTG